MQKIAPSLVCALFLALAAAIGTHFTLKTLYGVPAPAPLLAAPQLAAPSLPAWLTSGDAPQASDLNLLGVVAQSTDGTRGLALLQVVGGDRAKVFAVGQTLPNGAVLKAVSARSVTIDAQGSLQTVALDLKSSALAAVNPQRGTALIENAMAMPNSVSNPIPNPMSLNASAINAQNARLQAKRLRAAPAANVAPLNEAPPEQGQQP